jgi:hypothetical protein
MFASTSANSSSSSSARAAFGRTHAPTSIEPPIASAAIAPSDTSALLRVVSSCTRGVTSRVDVDVVARERTDDDERLRGARDVARIVVARIVVALVVVIARRNVVI